MPGQPKPVPSTPDRGNQSPETRRSPESTPPLSSGEAAPGIPQQIGRYRILRKLGEGGMGSVYLADDTQLKRRVALKIPKFAANERPEVIQRFYREAQAAATLQHRNICTVHDVGQSEGLHYLTMAYIEGRTLAELIRPDKPLPERQVAILVRKLALALDEAHRQGILHRDLKPSNILIDRQREPVIMDFGLAKRVGADEDHLTKTGAILGTAAFMSPEQVETPESIGPAADVYSLGVILYQLLTGRLPFDGPPASVIGQLLIKEPEPVESLRPEVSPQLAEICRKAMAKRIDQRYASMAELAAGLTEYLQRKLEEASLANHSTSDAALVSFLQTVAQPVLTRPHEPPPHFSIGREKRFRLRVQRAIASVIRRPMMVLAAGGAIVAVVLFLGLALSPRPHGANPLRGDRANDRAEGTNDASSAAPSEKQPPAPAISPFDAATAKKHQQAWADYLEQPAEQEVDLGGAVKLTMVLIPPGEFVMGSPVEERARFLEEVRSAGHQVAIERIHAEGPQHRVRITRAFRLGRHEVTVRQFRQFVDQTGYKTDAERDGKGGRGLVDGQWVQHPRFVWNGAPGFEQTDEHPVVNVSWNDAMAFCKWLSKKVGTVFILPTESQWEYACRAGTTTAWYCGDSEGTLDEYGWSLRNSGHKTHPVGQLKPNGWSLHDMYGNVWEWCADHCTTDSNSQSPPNDLSGPAKDWKYFRGGSWDHHAAYCRSAYRNNGVSQGRDVRIGFRLVAVLADE